MSCIIQPKQRYPQKQHPLLSSWSLANTTRELEFRPFFTCCLAFSVSRAVSRFSCEVYSHDGHPAALRVVVLERLGALQSQSESSFVPVAKRDQKDTTDLGVNDLETPAEVGRAVKTWEWEGVGPGSKRHQWFLVAHEVGVDVAFKAVWIGSMGKNQNM